MVSEQVFVVLRQGIEEGVEKCDEIVMGGGVGEWSEGLAGVMGGLMGVLTGVL